MIIQVIRTLNMLLVGSKYEPVNSLHKQKSEVNFKDYDWTFIALALAMLSFFVFIIVFQVGNDYPNHLMENL